MLIMYIYKTPYKSFHVFVTGAFDFCVSSSNALQQRPSLRCGGGELPAAAGWRGPVEPQRYSNTTD